MKFIPLLLLLNLLWLMACGDNNNGYITPTDDIIQVNADIMTDTGDVTIAFGSDSVLLTIPKGTSSSPITLTIKRLDTIPYPEEINILSAYEVSLDCGTSFSPPLKFTFPYDPTQVTYLDSLKPVYFNSVSKKWTPYETFELDSINNTISFESDHLTPVGFAEFLTNGGYRLKFTAVPGVCVYYNLSGTHAVMDSYSESEESYHISPSDSNWAMLYIQDIAFALSEVREIFAASPYSFDGPDSTETVNVYVKNLKGSNGLYGSVSGAIYVTNKLEDITIPEGVSHRQDLYSIVAHEYLHLIQDYYYVMNKGSIGVWWLEALATQADRLAWPSAYSYYESEIFAINFKSALADMISKSWDTNNEDPNWYLAGFFLHYLGFYRDGAKLSIADLLKAGGEGVSYLRTILNSQIELELGSTLDVEYADFIRFLFEDESETTFNKSLIYAETNADLGTTVSLEKDPKKGTIVKAVPYLSTQLITLKSVDVDTVSFLLKASSNEADVWLCSSDGNILTGWTPITEIGYEVVLPKKMDKAYVVIINSSFAGGVDSVAVTYQPVTSIIKPFHTVSLDIDFAENDIIYSNSESNDNSFSLGFYYDAVNTIYGYLPVTSSFKADGTFEVISKKYRLTGTSDTTTVKVTGLYDENSLYDVEFTETQTEIITNFSYCPAGTDTIHQGTYYHYEDKKIKIGQIPLDTIPGNTYSSSDMGYTYFKRWILGSEIAAQIEDFSHNYVSYWIGEGITDTLDVYTEAIPTQIDWTKASSMIFTSYVIEETP